MSKTYKNKMPKKKRIHLLNIRSVLLGRATFVFLALVLSLVVVIVVTRNFIFIGKELNRAFGEGNAKNMNTMFDIEAFKKLNLLSE